MFSCNQEGVNFDMTTDVIQSGMWQSGVQMGLQSRPTPTSNSNQIQHWPQQQIWQTTPVTDGFEHRTASQRWNHQSCASNYLANFDPSIPSTVESLIQVPESQILLLQNAAAYNNIAPQPFPAQYQNGPNVKAKMALVPNVSGGLKAIVKRKRKRTKFTTEQIEDLESIFSRRQYITREERQVLVEQLQISDSAIKVWFQNRRLRGKRELEQVYEENYPTEQSLYSPPNSVRLDYIESELNQKADQNGYVTLDEKDLEVIVSVIDSVLSTDVRLNPAPGRTSGVVGDSDESTYGSMYEPISPVASESTDDESPRWEPFEAEQSLQRLFDLHFC